MPSQKDDKTPLRDFRDPNHVRIDNMFVSGGYAAIIKNGLLIYAVLCQFHSHKTDSTRMSISTLMAKTGLSRPEIIKKLSQLKHYHIIDYTTQRGRGKSNVYTFPHCSTWKKIEKGKHSLLFTAKKKEGERARKGKHSLPIKPVKGKHSFTKKVNCVNPFKRSLSFQESGGGGQGMEVLNKRDSDFQKTDIPNNGNSQSKNVQSPPPLFFKKLSQEEEEKRKNLLHQQSQQIQQEANQ